VVCAAVWRAKYLGCRASARASRSWAGAWAAVACRSAQSRATLAGSNSRSDSSLHAVHSIHQQDRCMLSRCRAWLSALAECN
jgi:hypothetical protein